MQTRTPGGSDGRTSRKATATSVPIEAHVGAVEHHDVARLQALEGHGSHLLEAAAVHLVAQLVDLGPGRGVDRREAGAQPEVLDGAPGEAGGVARAHLHVAGRVALGEEAVEGDRVEPGEVVVVPPGRGRPGLARDGPQRGEVRARSGPAWRGSGRGPRRTPRRAGGAAGGRPTRSGPAEATGYSVSSTEPGASRSSRARARSSRARRRASRRAASRARATSPAG